MASRRSRRIRRDLGTFVGVGLLVTLGISLGAVLVIRQVAQNEAMAEDQRVTERLASVVAGPLGRLLEGDPTGRREVDQLVAARLRDGTISKIDVWALDGQILFADDVVTTGARFPPPGEAVEAITQLVATADLETRPETGPAEEPVQVEVYVPLQLPGHIVAFEAYFSLRTVERQTSALTAQLVPPTVGALVLLQLVQVPIAVSLARRARRHEAEHSRLLQRALTASEHERKEIAARIHDGIVQDLAGASYVLGALSMSMPADRRHVTDRVDTTIRGVVSSLRKLMVDVYPPDLDGPGLADAIAGLAEPVAAAGVDVDLHLRVPVGLDPEIAATLYRIVRESLANVLTHAHATAVAVRLTADDHPGWAARPAVHLQVADNGLGPPADGVDRRAEGHLGLRILTDRVEELGGELTLGPGSPRGAVVDARMPTRPGGPTFRGRPASGPRGWARRLHGRSVIPAPDPGAEGHTPLPGAAPPHPAGSPGD